MLGPADEEIPHEGIFLDVTPGARFVITDARDWHWHPRQPFMTGIWAIASEGDGTRYTACARYWTDAAIRRHEEMVFTVGWLTCADQLAALAEGA